MIKVAIIFGGPGSEHEVSISSAKNILEHIDRTAFDVIEIFVTKDKKYIIDRKTFSEEEGIQEIKNMNVEVVFPIIHGEYGEDGELQSKLEKEKISFIGSSSTTSHLAIDKNKTNEILSKNNLHIPKSKIISIHNKSIDFRFPIIVKPINEGSSIGLFKIETEQQYKDSLEAIFENHNEMLAQEFVEGREFTCGVIEKEGMVTSLVATEVILTKGELFDYEAKYSPAGCEEITPAQVDTVMMSEIQNIAMTCHKILGCRTLSRTDLILKGDRLYVLEVNTSPGMTKTSFIPAQAQVCGYSMKELITILIDSVKYSR